jgi:pSer/pThr/pTyr-binding forkhead associated (FHA) protein
VKERLVSAQPAVLQVVILRDGLLVGTEVFVPGHYTLGSGATADLHLDDPSVADAHAHLFFQNGRAAIQDAGSGGVFVNGHRVNACEVRAVDEVACGPFTLKIRVMSQRPNTKPAPSAEVSAILGNAHPPPSRPPVPPPPSAPQAAPPVGLATATSACAANERSAGAHRLVATAASSHGGLEPTPGQHRASRC